MIHLSFGREFSINNLLLLILTSLITFYMKVGYDGLLYHLPHQSFIKDYKIIFGLFNLHERFGIISLYGYISSLFWVGNDLKIISYLQGCFYFILFYSLKNYIFDKLYKFHLSSVQSYH